MDVSICRGFMAKISTVLLTTVVLSGCFSCGQKDTKQPVTGQQDFVKEYKVYGEFKQGKRIILTHGVSGTDAQYLLGPEGVGALPILKDRLVTEGYQVITFTYPNTTADIFIDGGRLYKQQYRAFLDWMLLDLNKRYGIATELDIGGFSFGGLHAMIALTIEPHKFDRYLAIDPVSDPSLTTIFGPYQATDFNAFKELGVLSSINGIILTTQNDNILGYKNAENLCYAIGGKCTYYKEIDPRILHDVTVNMVDQIMAWLNH